MNRQWLAIFGAVALLFVPGPLWAQGIPVPPCGKMQLSACGDMFKTGIIEEEKLKKDFQDKLIEIRNSSASDSDKQKLIMEETKAYQEKSTYLAVTYREPALKVINELANETGVITAKDGTTIIPDQSGPSAPIVPSTGTKPSQSGYRGMASDTDSMGGSKTIDKIPDILNQMGLTDVVVKTTAGYTSVEDLKVTYHKPSSAIGSAIGPPGSSAHQTQVAVDAKSKETYVSESMTDQPGKTYVAVMDHTKKANEGLKSDPITLLNNTDEVLQTLAKGTMKAGVELYGQENMAAKLGEILKNNNIQITGIPPEQFGELLVKLKTGSDVAPDGVGLNKDNIEAFQKACKTALDQIQAEAKQKADAEMEKIDDEIKAKEATGNPADKEEAQKLREKKVDSKVKIEQSEKFNKPYSKPPSGPGEDPGASKGTAAGEGKDDDPVVTKVDPKAKDKGEPAMKLPGGKKDEDSILTKTGPKAKDGDDPVKKPPGAKQEDGSDAKKTGGQLEPADSGGIPLPKPPASPDVTVKFFEKFFGKDVALYNDTKTGGFIGKDGTIGAGKIDTQIGQAGMKSQFEVTAGEDGAKLTAVQEFEANLIKIQTMTTVGNETFTGTVTTEGKVGTNAAVNLNAYTGPLAMGSSGGFDVFAGAKGSMSGSLLLDLKQWLGVSFEGTVGGEAGVGVGAKGYYNAELSWGGVKVKGGAAGYTGAGGGVNTGINIDASPLVFGVDLAQADQDGAKSDILQTILYQLKNNVIQMPEGKKFSDIAQDIDTYSTAVVKQPNVIKTGSDGKPVFTPAEFVINQIGFRPPVSVVPGVKPSPPDPEVLAMKAADLKQAAWEKAVLGGKVNPDEYAKFEAGYNPATFTYTSPVKWQAKGDEPAETEKTTATTGPPDGSKSPPQTGGDRCDRGYEDRHAFGRSDGIRLTDFALCIRPDKTIYKTAAGGANFQKVIEEIDSPMLVNDAIIGGVLDLDIPPQFWKGTYKKYCIGPWTFAMIPDDWSFGRGGGFAYVNAMGVIAQFRMYKGALVAHYDCCIVGNSWRKEWIGADGYWEDSPLLFDTKGGVAKSVTVAQKMASPPKSPEGPIQELPDKSSELTGLQDPQQTDIAIPDKGVASADPGGKKTGDSLRDKAQPVDGSGQPLAGKTRDHKSPVRIDMAPGSPRGRPADSYDQQVSEALAGVHTAGMPDRPAKDSRPPGSPRGRPADSYDQQVSEALAGAHTAGMPDRPAKDSRPPGSPRGRPADSYDQQVSEALVNVDTGTATVSQVKGGEMTVSAHGRPSGDYHREINNTPVKVDPGAKSIDMTKPKVTPAPARKTDPGASTLAGTYNGTVVMTPQFHDAKSAKAAAMAGVNKPLRENTTIVIETNGTVILKGSRGTIRGTLRGSSFSIQGTNGKAVMNLQGTVGNGKITATGTSKSVDGRMAYQLSLSASK